MKRNIFVTTLLYVALLASCKKSDTPGDALIGTWKSTKEAIDLNKNGIMDSSEITVRTDANYIFNKDGTGSYLNGPHGSGMGYYTWAKQSNNDIYLNIDSSPAIVVDTVHIYSIAASNLILGIMIKNAPVYWLILTKQ